MGILALIGMVVCFASVLIGIIGLGGKIGNFLDPASFALTIIPTFGALLTTCPLSLLSKIPAHFKVILGKGYSPDTYIKQIIELAQIARTNGLLALEAEEGKINDSYLKYGIRLLTVGAEDSTIKKSMLAELSGITTRHAEAANIYEKAAAYVPAFGMCATVVSLVNMLSGLDFNDPNAINSLGTNMSAALITTFYGSMFANIIFLPIAGRLKLMHKKEIFCKEMVIDGILAINRGENPANIQDMFSAQLNKGERKQFGIGGGGA